MTLELPMSYLRAAASLSAFVIGALRIGVVGQINMLIVSIRCNHWKWSNVYNKVEIRFTLDVAACRSATPIFARYSDQAFERFIHAKTGALS
jgi:hypothetical protein